MRWRVVIVVFISRRPVFPTDELVHVRRFLTSGGSFSHGCLFFSRFPPPCPPAPRPPSVQVGKPNPEYEGVFDAGQKIFKAHGIRGAYQGFNAVLLRNFPCFGAYFFCSEVGIVGLRTLPCVFGDM